MDEKKRKIKVICSIVGIVAFFINTILPEEDIICFELKILFVVIAAIAYAIRLGIEITNNDLGWTFSCFVIAVCLVDIYININLMLML